MLFSINPPVLLIFILLFVLTLVALYFGVGFLLLFWNRARLVRKLEKKADEVTLCRGRFYSLFHIDGKPDLIVRKGERTYALSILSTPFSRFRYHFEKNERLSLYWEHSGAFLDNRPKPRSFKEFDRSLAVLKYRISYAEAPDAQTYVIPSPAPVFVTRSSGDGTDALYNDDVLFDQIRIAGSKYFLQEILSEEGSASDPK